MPMRRALLGCLVLIAQLAFAGAIGLPPHLDQRGLSAYQAFLSAPGHRAFVIAPGGAWAWVSEQPTAEAALAAARAECERHTDQRCVPYAVDERSAFDVPGWHALWRPYLSRAQAARARVGTRRRERFFDLSFYDADGRAMRLSGLRGHVVVLHMWGSWCAPCRHELPQLAKLQQRLAAIGDVHLVLLQAREPFPIGARWVQQQGLRLPLYDSGVGAEARHFRLANGDLIADRAIAPVFPTTYVLDKRGVVLFSHAGPIADWSQYLPFLLDAGAAR